MRSGFIARLALVVGCLLSGGPFLMPRAAAQAPKKLTYDEHVQPLLREKCFSCHNQDKQRGGVALHNYLAVMEGGSSGKIVQPGDPEASKLFRVMAHLEEPIMPPKSPKLPDANLNLIRDWIKGGALENAGSKAKAPEKPKHELVVPASAVGKPDGPPPLPPEKLPLEPAVVTPRANAVQALAANPWSPLLAVGGHKAVLLYDAQTLLLLGILPFPEGTPHVLKFSRNGSLLLAGGGRDGKSGLVVVWDVRTGERVMQVGDETDAVLAADLSPDQSQIALGGPSKVVRIFSTKDGQKLRDIKKHTDWVTAIEYSPDGVLLATGDRSGGLQIWETGTGQEHLTLRGHTAFITDVSWRVDSNILASASEDSTVRLWEMENGRQVRGWGAHGGGTLSVAFARDGRLASVGRDRVTKLWDQAGKQLQTYEAFGDVGLRVAIAGEKATHVAAGDWSGELRVWHASTGRPVGRTNINPPSRGEQLRNVEQRLAEAKKQIEPLAAELAKQQAALAQAKANVAALQRKLNDGNKAVQAATAALAKAKSAVDPTLAALQAAQAAIPGKEQTAKLLAEAASKAKAASDQNPGNAELTAFSGQSQALATKAQTELAAARKYAADLAAAAQPLQQQLAAATAAEAQAKQAVATLTTELTQAQNSLKTTQTSTAAAVSSKAELDSLLAGLEKQRVRLQTSLAQAK